MNDVTIEIESATAIVGSWSPVFIIFKEAYLQMYLSQYAIAM